MAFLSSLIQITRSLVTAFRGSPSSSRSSPTDSQKVIEDELKGLEMTLWNIEAVLEDAGRREIRDASVRLWLKELKGIAYDAEDVLDEYEYELFQCQVDSRNNAAAAAATRISRKRKHVDSEEEQVYFSQTSTISRGPSFPNHMLDRIRKIRERFSEIEKDRSALSLRELGPRRFDYDDDSDSIKRPPPSSSVDESHVFGRDGDKEMLIELLVSDMNSKFSVIPIVGMGGLGKTTLVQLIYKDQRIQGCFDLKGWVYVSVNFSVLRLTKLIIETLSGQQSCAFLELDKLQSVLSESVAGKKVLLVLDDVWNEEQSPWQLLQAPFANANMVRIIVTTRNSSVAKVMQTGISPHELALLPEKHSWLLFKQYAFVGQEPSFQFVDIGKQIVKKCNGLPLAVKALGGILRYETEESSWWDVLQSDLWELDEAQSEILPALKLSYSRMPSYLKPCFLFCSMYPKAHLFSKGNLIRLWMAQGYIRVKGNKIMEDVGENYFNELQQRSYFQLYQNPHMQLTTGNEHEWYVMHDMLQDLAHLISENECFSIYASEGQAVQPEISNEIRHLKVMHQSVMEVELAELLSLKEINYLRTLDCLEIIYIGKRDSSLTKFERLRALELQSESPQGLLAFIGSFKHLRYLSVKSNIIWEALPQLVCQCYYLQTLDLKGCLLQEIPNDISNLINLRCLALSSFSLAQLPETIGNLHNLHTLDVQSCYSLQELPQGISNLAKLRHLFIPSESKLPRGIGKLTNLETLEYFIAGKGNKIEKHSGIEELKNLVNIKGNLCISELGKLVSVDSVIEGNLKTKSRLKDLRLNWGYLQHPYMDNLFSEELNFSVLDRLEPHHNLLSLKIEGYKGLDYPAWLGEPSFTRLTSIDFNFCKQIQDFPWLTSRLPSLTSLSFYTIERMKSVAHEGEVSFPSLEVLSFKNMPEWDNWNSVMDKDFPKLKKLAIQICPKICEFPSFQTLVKLTIAYCENLKSVTVHHDAASCPSRLNELLIISCGQLTSLVGLKYLYSLSMLTIEACSELRFQPDDCLPVMPKHVRICDGDGPKHWCDNHGFHYKQFCSFDLFPKDEV
ncbi:P-loop containing nucleoside triphosphate hydrolase protein [Dioscorea alata]|uniref:P-loop containing nucleoside triphosphate hydrolase protein n=2 Tax=Dioscorea alata TaxID=55571 RepID=A0ACB7VRZ6_DIOAL|nr:P-loop containing nucleoside triphosphate hydrolase protein [Dioscorea alata]KAH7677428.1 P-loop containing nucleoside triphosphate hydrolase protein [Dioscorea alata]